MNSDQKQLGDRVFNRTAIQTHKLALGESLIDAITKYAKSEIKPSSFLCLSQKVVAICEKNVVHISEVKASWLAHLITKFVRKWPNDIGYERPEKMQVAIQQAGYPRMILAVIVGGITRLFGRHGDFYRIAGNKIAEIDGFNPKAMKPFDEYAMIPVADEKAVAERIRKKFNVPCYIIDGNNINVKVTAASEGFEELNLDASELRLLMLDNPMGQDDELTPIFVITETKWR